MIVAVFAAVGFGYSSTAFAADPAISSLSPSSVPLDQGYAATQVTAYGSGFDADTVLYIPSLNGELIMTADGTKIIPDAQTATALVFHVPATMPLGSYPVYATRPGLTLRNPAVIFLTSSQPPKVTLTLTPSTIPNGGTFTASWVGENVMACSGYGPGFTGGQTLFKTGSKTITYNFYPGQYPVSISCTKVDGTFAASDQKTLTVTGPVINSFSITPSDVTVGTASSSNSNFTIAWATTGATSCKAIPVVDLSGVAATYEQAGSFPGQATFWAGDVGIAGSRSLSLPKTAWPNTYTFGLSCSDANGVTTKTTERLNATWLEGKPKTITINTPAGGSALTPGVSQPIAWTSTWLPSTLKGTLYLQTHTGAACIPPPGPSPTAPTMLTTNSPALLEYQQCLQRAAGATGPKKYLIADNVSNSGSYSWSSAGAVFTVNPEGIAMGSLKCKQVSDPPWNCYTAPTKVTGTFDLMLTLLAEPGDVFDTNTLGQFIVNGLPSNIVSKMPFTSSPLYLSIGGTGSQSTPPVATSTPVVVPTSTSPIPTVSAPAGLGEACGGLPVVSCAAGYYCKLNTEIAGPIARGVCAVKSDTTPPTTSPADKALLDQINALLTQIKSLQGGTTQPTQVSGGTTTGGGASVGVMIQHNLRYGTRDTQTDKDVTSLQSFLYARTYLDVAPTGFFGAKTLGAVKKYQLDKGLPSTGYVGPMTRTKLQSEGASTVDF